LKKHDTVPPLSPLAAEGFVEKQNIILFSSIQGEADFFNPSSFRYILKPIIEDNFQTKWELSIVCSNFIVQYIQKLAK